MMHILSQRPSKFNVIYQWSDEKWSTMIAKRISIIFQFVYYKYLIVLKKFNLLW